MIVVENMRAPTSRASRSLATMATTAVPSLAKIGESPQDEPALQAGAKRFHEYGNARSFHGKRYCQSDAACLFRGQRRRVSSTQRSESGSGKDLARRTRALTKRPRASDGDFHRLAVESFLDGQQRSDVTAKVRLHEWIVAIHAYRTLSRTSDTAGQLGQFPGGAEPVRNDRRRPAFEARVEAEEPAAGGAGENQARHVTLPLRAPRHDWSTNGMLRRPRRSPASV